VEAMFNLKQNTGDRGDDAAYGCASVCQF